MMTTILFLLVLFLFLVYCLGCERTGWLVGGYVDYRLLVFSKLYRVLGNDQCQYLGYVRIGGLLDWDIF